MLKMLIMWFLQLMCIQVKVVIYINIVEFVTSFDNELIFLYGFGTCNSIMIDLK
jgi:hypothetical protein